MNKTKLTLVSASFRGIRVSMFVELEVDEREKVKFDYQKLMDKFYPSPSRGQTFTLS